VQRDFELVMLHSGEGRVTLNKTVHDLKIGKVYLFLPGGREHFHFAADKETHHSWCAIRPRFMPESLKKILRRAPFSAQCSDLFHSQVASALKLRGLRDTATRILIEQLGLCLFAEFLHASRASYSDLGDQAVRNFLQYIEDHFGEQDCMEAARRAAGVSRSTLVYKFRTFMQSTPGSYLWNHRVERGAAMLAETGYTVAEIAYHCGFKNPFHFSRKLKEQCGRSPREIRRETQSKEPTS
jgi:AraC-like DNA-binding protein